MATCQSRLQHFLDIANPKIERSRANFDLTHMIKADGYYELPFGKGHKLSYRPLEPRDRRLDSGRHAWCGNRARRSRFFRDAARLNRESRSYYNTADTSLTKAQLD